MLRVKKTKESSRDHYLRNTPIPLSDVLPYKYGSGFRDPLFAVITINMEDTKKYISKQPVVARGGYGEAKLVAYRTQIDEDTFVDRWVITQNNLTTTEFTFKLIDGGLLSLGAGIFPTQGPDFADVFYNFYLSKFDFILSDSYHTIQTERYWKRILNRGIKLSHLITTKKYGSEITVTADDLENFWKLGRPLPHCQFKIFHNRY